MGKIVQSFVGFLLYALVDHQFIQVKYSTNIEYSPSHGLYEF